MPRTQRSRPSRVFGGLTAAVAVAALAGCSAGQQAGDGPDEEPAVTATPHVEGTSQLTFPLDAYRTTDKDRERFRHGADVLKTRCMRRYGFDYEPVEQPDRAESSDEYALLYGSYDADWAAEHGYLNPGFDSAPPAKPAPPELGPNEELALSGPARLDPKTLPDTLQEAQKRMKEKGGKRINGEKLPPWGCRYEANLKLFRAAEEPVDRLFVQNLRFDAHLRAQEDSRVAAAIDEWSACMAENGYEVSNPVSPQEELGLEPGEFDGPTAVAAARRDVECKKETRLVDIWYAVEKAYQKRAIDENAETLELFESQRADRLRRIDELTS